MKPEKHEIENKLLDILIYFHSVVVNKFLMNTGADFAFMLNICIRKQERVSACDIVAT